MTYYLEDQPGISTWDQLAPMTPWTVVYDDEQHALLIRGAGAIAVQERPGAWRARHRRALHRLGFRRRARLDCAMWEWTPPQAAVREEVDRVFTVPATTASLQQLFALDLLLDARCVVVLRDVFGLTPADLHLAVLVDDEDEDWDEVG
jgi:hypothetical protein